MKKRLTIIVVLFLTGFVIYWFIFKKKEPGTREPKAEAIAVKKHSEQFNNSIDRVIESYLSIKDAFVDADTVRAKQHARLFINRLDSIPIDELKNDNASIVESAKGTIADLASNANSLLQQTDITEMRQDFRMVTEMMYPAFFKTINYEGPKLYLQNCPMAFGEDKAADWISNSTEVINPYLGKNHPEYKGTMLHCGEIKDTIKAQ